MIKTIKEFLAHESATGVALLIATVLALLSANSALENYYNDFLNIKFEVFYGTWQLSKPFYLWINDGLMAVFFFLVGLELKREFKIGQLTELEAILLPIVGALGGIIVPVILFYCFNHNNSFNLSGWAIPAATDIAFAVAVLSFCSNKVPTWAKVFLLTLAIFDDLVAILIIAVFYTTTISYLALFCVFIAILLLSILNRCNVNKLAIYMLMGCILWLAVLKSGVHATLAGVITAFFVPFNNKTRNLERNLSPWVSFLILPLFAFANTGINVEQLVASGINNSISLGSGLGLFFGKQLGVFCFSVGLILLYGYKKPKGFNFKILYGLSVLCGIGFTMSIFIASLAYGNNDYIGHTQMLQARAGIMLGSLASAVYGLMILKYQFKKINISK